MAKKAYRVKFVEGLEIYIIAESDDEAKSTACMYVWEANGRWLTVLSVEEVGNALPV